MFLGAQRPTNPYRVSCRSVQGTKKKQKKRKEEEKNKLGLNISPHPKRPPFTCTFRFVHVVWGHRRNRPCQVSSQSVQQFRLPKGSTFTISHRLGEWLLQQCYALTCYTVMFVNIITCCKNEFLSYNQGCFVRM